MLGRGGETCRQGHAACARMKEVLGACLGCEHLAPPESVRRGGIVPQCGGLLYAAPARGWARVPRVPQLGPQRPERGQQLGALRSAARGESGQPREQTMRCDQGVTHEAHVVTRG